MNVNNKQGDLTMLKLLAKLFGRKSAEQPVPEQAPYKVEAPKAPAEVEVSAAKFEGELKSPTELQVEVLQAQKTEAKKKAPAKKKPAAPKKEGAKKGGRKPKSTTQA